VTAVIAILLLTAALAKTYQLATELISWDAFTRAEYLLVALIAGELALAGLILSGRHVRLTRILALATFLAFAAYSLYLALRDEPSCGCFGRVPVSPWVTFALDLAIVAALLISRTPATDRSNVGETLCPYLAGAAVCCLVTSVGLAQWFGSLQVALAHMTGDSLLLQPNGIRIGAEGRGSTRELLVTVTNLDSQPIQLVGAKPACATYFREGFPSELAPGERRELSLYVRFEGQEPGEFSRTLFLYTDSKTQPVVALVIRGSILN
jgi:hypothetical protein